MVHFAEDWTELFSELRTVRWVSFILGFLNAGLILMSGFLLVLAPPICDGGDKMAVLLVSMAAGIRIFYMVRAGKAQRATAETIIGHVSDSSGIPNSVISHERRMRYRRWLWWTRLGLMVTVLQFVVALYLMIAVLKERSAGSSKTCFSGRHSEGRSWKHIVLILFLVTVWLVVIVQCATGSDVLRWRSFYASYDTAWRAHYREVFDHGIREVFCCLGRTKYLSESEDDEVYSVARLLGDLMTYRASGAGHLELLAGLALLQKHKQSTVSYDDFEEAPKARIQEAALLHQYAEAAYTGLLLDLGRNPLLFPCVWLYRQSALTPWTRNRRPVLEGDNWWRGHAAAFLKYVNLSPEALRKGRVNQKKCEAAYFVIVLHDLKTILIAVRGTETPEDLITDGLCGECTLTQDDLDGLINSEHLTPHVRESVLSSFPHFGHSGIVESARELYMKIDGQTIDGGNSQSEICGFLSSLVERGCECHGYNIRIVGHSLGGAVAALLGMRLYGRYPNLHVYSYGPLPCVDSVIAEACSEFVTSIVYNDEFSSRLSVNSILRLRGAAIGALSNDCSENSAMLSNLLRRILNARRSNSNEELGPPPAQSLQAAAPTIDSNQLHNKHLLYTIRGGAFLCGHAISCMMHSPNHQVSSGGMDNLELSSHHTPEAIVIRNKGCSHSCTHIENSDGVSTNKNSDILQEWKEGFSEASTNGGPRSIDNAVDHAPRTVVNPLNGSARQSPELYLPGVIVHIVPGPKATSPLWKNWINHDRGQDYKAFIANRESFTDIVVSTYMFLDHLPWRCNHAMQRVLESQKQQDPLSYNSFITENIV